MGAAGGVGHLEPDRPALELLDQATDRIEASDDDFLRVYMYAAVANAAVPGFLDRADFARRYFDAVREHEDFGAMEPRTRASVYAWLARLEGLDTGAGEALLAQAEALDQALVAFLVLPLDVVEEVPAVADELEKATARVVVLLVFLEVLGEVRDALGHQRDLDLGGPGVLLVRRPWRGWWSHISGVQW